MERQPAVADEALLVGAVPQQRHVDAVIRSTGSRIDRERRLSIAPRADPRHIAVFQLSNNLVGDFLVNIVTSVHRAILMEEAGAASIRKRLRQGGVKPVQPSKPAHSGRDS